MSEEPSDLQRGDANSRHIAARQRLQGLVSERDKTVSTLRSVAQALEGGAVTGVRRSTVVIEAGIQGGVTTELNWPGALDIGDMARAVRETEEELRSLAARFRELEMEDYLSS